MGFYRYTYYPSTGNIKVSLQNEGVMVEELATYSLNSNNYIFYKDYYLDNNISKKEFITCCRLELKILKKKLLKDIDTKLITSRQLRK